MPKFSDDLEATLQHALEAARSRKQEYATLEHLLLALIDDPDAGKALETCGANIQELKETVTHYLNEELDTLQTEHDVDPSPASAFQRVIQRAILHVQSQGKDKIDGTNVLIALFSERESYAVYFMRQQDVSRLDVVNYLFHGIDKNKIAEAERLRQIESSRIAFEKWLDTTIPILGHEFNQSAKNALQDRVLETVKVFIAERKLSQG